MSALKSITIRVATAALLLASTAPSGWAQGRAPERGPQRQESPRANHAGQWLRRYKDLPPDQQQKALDNDPQFRSLPPARQQILRERLLRFSSLPPQKQNRILQRMETWEHLTPDQKQQARQLFSQLRDLPPDRRKKLRTAIRDLSAMPPAQRQQVIDSDRFKNEFSPQERGLLSGASQLPLAPAETAPNEPTNPRPKTSGRSEQFGARTMSAGSRQDSAADPFETARTLTGSPPCRSKVRNDEDGAPSSLRFFGKTGRGTSQKPASRYQSRRAGVGRLQFQLANRVPSAAEVGEPHLGILSG